VANECVSDETQKTPRDGVGDNEVSTAIL